MILVTRSGITTTPTNRSARAVRNVEAFLELPELKYIIRLSMENVQNSID